MTKERLAELERAAARCVDSGHPEWAQSLRADELAELCRAVRWWLSGWSVVRKDAPTGNDADGQRVLPAGVDLLALGKVEDDDWGRDGIDTR